MKVLTQARAGRATPLRKGRAGADEFISTYRRSHFRFSQDLFVNSEFPQRVRIEIGRRYAYVVPVPPPTDPEEEAGLMKVDDWGKFSSRRLKDWLGDPPHVTHWPATRLAGGMIRIDKDLAVYRPSRKEIL